MLIIVIVQVVWWSDTKTPDTKYLNACNNLQPIKMGISMPNILIVDDDDGNRTGIALALEQHGYSAQEAENGKEAMLKVSEHNLDLAISDLMLPDMNGLSLYEKIKEKSLQTKFFIITAYPYSPEADEVRKLNVDIMEKPFGVQAITGKVRQILGE
jgi:DNA-binding NtrC family response regulator